MSNKHLNTLRRWINLHAIIYEYDLSNPAEYYLQEELPEGYTFRSVSDVPIKMLRSFSLDNRDPGQFHRTIVPNLANPKNAFGLCILYKEVEIASLGWVYIRPPSSRRGERYPTAPQACYPMDGFVAKPHRGKGLHRKCVRRRLQMAAERGSNVGYGAVYANNTPAIKDNDRLGKRIGRMYGLRFPRKKVNIYCPSRWRLFFREHL